MNGRVLGGVLALAVVAAGPAWAAPGDLPSDLPADPADPSGDRGEPLTLLAPSPARACVKAGAVCWFATARTTIAVEATPTPVEPPARKSAAPVPVLPRFARAASLAGTTISGPAASGAWTVEVAATLKRPAYAGNTIFLLFDAGDPEALSARQFTGLYQATVKAGSRLAARLILSPDEGFRAGHTYRLRVVQLIGNREILLAEGDATLL